MSNSFEPYSNPKNLLAIRTLAWQIVRDVAPDEELSAKKMTELIVRAWEEGHFIAANNATNAGGFGDIDLALLVIVPIIIIVLDELAKHWLAQDMVAIKERIQENDINRSTALKIVNLTVEREYRLVNEKIKSKKARSKEKHTKEAIQRYITKVFELEH